MRDRVSRNPGRVKLTPVAGETNVYDMVQMDNPIEDGTLLSKANLLSADAESAIFSNSAGNHTLSQAFISLMARFKPQVIITSSGTFNPASYGLKVGDTINIICVGGGGGGSSAYYWNGSTYSFTNGYDAGVKKGKSEYFRGDSGDGYGAGGGGGGGKNAKGTCFGGGGGGSGYVAEKSYILENINPITVTIGSAGAGGKNGAGLSGGTTSFGNIASAMGGNGGGKTENSKYNLGGSGGNGGGYGAFSNSSPYNYPGGGGGGGYLIGVPYGFSTCDIEGAGITGGAGGTTFDRTDYLTETGQGQGIICSGKGVVILYW